MKKEDTQLMRGVKEYIDSNVRKESSVKEICAEFGVNKNKLQIGFKLLFGQTIHAYVIQQRMKRAAEMLKNTDSPIKSVAAEIGLTQSNFHMNFKRTFGHSPERFRRKENTE